jgi:hypothetical protein
LLSSFQQNWFHVDRSFQTLDFVVLSLSHFWIKKKEKEEGHGWYLHRSTAGGTTLGTTPGTAKQVCLQYKSQGVGRAAGTEAGGTTRDRPEVLVPSSRAARSLRCLRHTNGTTTPSWPVLPAMKPPMGRFLRPPF